MLRIDCSQAIYSFSPKNTPAARAFLGDEIIFDTKDAFCNQIKTENDLVTSIDWAAINPATGPVYIEGVKPGDTLRVEIKDILVSDKGVMSTGPDMGALGHAIKLHQTKIIPVIDNCIIYNEHIKIPIDPMIGVIGTAPETEDMPCGTPGSHGGNMDTRLIKKGAVLYLPVFVEGGLLAMGDLHALMGDGEVAVCGVEIAGEVIVKVDAVKGKIEEWPVLETPTDWYIIASGQDLDEAAHFAMDSMLDFLKKRLLLETNDIVSLLSIAGSLEICQVVDPLKTMRMGISKSSLSSYDLNF